MKAAPRIQSTVKKSLITRVVPLVTAISLLTAPVIPLSITSSQADAGGSYTTLNSFSGHPDADLTVSGGNYAANEVVAIVASQNGAMVASSTTNASASGQFSTSLQLPVKLAQGAVAITATGKTSGLSSANSYYAVPFTPGLVPSSTQTTPYSTLTVNGSGYAPDETVDLNLAGSTTTAQTDATGSFANVSLKTPVVPAASYTLVGAGEASGASAVAYEYVNGFYPNAAPSSYYVMPATNLGFTGSGFAANETVIVTDATTLTQVSSFVTDANGSFKNAGSFVVPASYAGLTKKFVLTGSLSHATTTTSTAIGQYYPNVSPTKYYVLPGGTFSFNGNGFVPGETVDVSNGTTALGTVTADAKGNLVAAGLITTTPAQAGTSQTYTLTGETSHGSGSVSVQVGSYNPNASPSNYYVTPGTVITFSGNGYAPGEVVTVLSGLNTIGTFNADATGSFLQSGSNMIAYNLSNTSVSYSLVGAVSKQAINFTIGVGQLNTQLSPSSYYVLPYAPFSVSATGFAPNENVTLMNGTTNLGSAVTNALGTATFNAVSLPYSKTGSATLIATGATSRATASVSIGMGNYYPTVTADNYYAKPGSTINLTGTGFIPGETVTYSIGTTSHTAVADAKGNFIGSIVLPFGSTTSSASITSVGSLSNASSVTTITLAPYIPQVSPSTYYAQPGTPISFTGSGFLPNEIVDVSLNSVKVGTETIDNLGNLTSTGSYSLPYGKAAAFTVTGETSHGSVTMNIGLAQFYASVQLNSYYGNGGSLVTVSGSGFAAGESVAIATGQTVLAHAVANTHGSFSTPITIPYAVAGALPITATGALSGAVATTGYTVAQVYNSVGLGSYAVPAGKALTITGSGFFANEPITVTGNRLSGSYSFNADANGNLNDSGDVLPATLAAGNLTLTITGAYSHTTHTIVMYVQDANAQ